MNTRLVLASSAVALGLAFSAPAMASSTGNGNSGNGSGSNIDNITKTLTSTVGNISLTYTPNISSSSTETTNITKVVADQDLKAVNINHNMGPVVENESGGYASGSNSVYGGAFAAFAGIQNVSWNSGIDANSQAASNIAAQGNVTFGSNNPAP